MEKFNYCLIRVLALIFMCTLNSYAAQNCLPDNAANQKALSRALGVVIYHKVLSDYAKYIDVNLVAEGMLASSGQSAKISIKKEETSDAMTENQAEEIIRNWRKTVVNVGATFEIEFAKKKLIQTSTGLLYHQWIVKDKVATEKIERCLNRLPNDDEKIKVCFLRIKVTEKELCRFNEAVSKQALPNAGDATESAESTALLKASDIINNELQSGIYAVGEVIDGWNELLVNKVEKKSKKDANKSGGNAKDYDVFEVVVPPKLGYGKKGAGNDVVPDETLWFLLAIQ